MRHLCSEKLDRASFFKSPGTSPAIGCGISRNEQREAQRPQGRGVSGAGTGAPCRNGRRRAAQAGTSWSKAAASVQAFQRDVMATDRAAEQAKPSRAVSRERPALRTGPQGANATAAAGRPTGAGSPTRRTRHQAKATAVVWRRLRRARHPAGRSGGPGLTSAGADVNAVQRSGTQRTTATARILSERRSRAGHCTAHTAARPDRTSPDGATKERRRKQTA